MAKIDDTCKEVIEKAEWFAIATAGPEGPHLAATWGDYIRSLGIKNNELLLVPVGGFQITERNLTADSRIELLCATKQVQGAHGAGKGCRIRGTAEIQSSGEHFAAAKKRFPWARGVLVVKIEEAVTQL